ncbi:MAG: zinc ribbon domain-containing protein [Acidithiobacillus ferriphilus]|nr:hypothetical protein [Acidithiobacillus ferriphilus]MBU2833806.1 hypothetical protein [Acidithiobacillus ferriphilus]MBU2853428.1 hypothetical protein [Acidithiobacillus ferriphilus]
MKTLSALQKYLLVHIHDEANRCQSCGMPLRFDKNNSPSGIYCSFCHDGTSFIDKNLTLQEMKCKVRKLLSERKVNRFIKLYLIMRLSTLKRWKSGWY